MYAFAVFKKANYIFYIESVPANIGGQIFLLMRCMTKSYCCIKRLCNEIVTYLTIV